MVLIFAYAGTRAALLWVAPSSIIKHDTEFQVRNISYLCKIQNSIKDQHHYKKDSLKTLFTRDNCKVATGNRKHAGAVTVTAWRHLFEWTLRIIKILI